ncbi:MAG TPA: SigE family RNA polymerase sigma factor [Marmoricola sp.]|nr:SigE family RNA polymerase sigma factor [Marmoricola sp.]
MDDGFDDFVRACAPRLLATAALLTRERDKAEDLLQTTLLKTWSAWSRIEDHPEAYARRTMVNTYTSWWRRRWNAEVPTGELPDRGRAGVDTAASTALAIDLRRAIDRLPRRQRAVVVLRWFEDLTEAQVAEVMGCSVGTVKSQASKALRKLGVDDALAHETVEVER